MFSLQNPEILRVKNLFAESLLPLLQTLNNDNKPRKDKSQGSGLQSDLGT